MATIDEIIDSVYHDPAGYGSMAYTLKHAKKKDPTIKLEDIRRGFENNIERTGKLRGFNSYVASKPNQEYQMDLMFFTEADLEFKVGMLMVDIFTKITVVVPLKTNQTDDVLEGLKKSFKQIGNYPEMLYTDNEGSLSSNIIKAYFKEHNIDHIITLSHAPVAERGIRGFKDSVYKRLKQNPDQKWYDLIYQILLKYNRLSIHSSIGMTPNEATDPKNLLKVKLNLELHRTRTRSYPDVEVGDTVKVYKKKKKMQKERVSVWSENRYTIESRSERHGQKFYKLTLYNRPLMRSEILKV